MAKRPVLGGMVALALLSIGWLALSAFNSPPRQEAHHSQVQVPLIAADFDPGRLQGALRDLKEQRQITLVPKAGPPSLLRQFLGGTDFAVTLDPEQPFGMHKANGGCAVLLLADPPCKRYVVRGFLRHVQADEDESKVGVIFGAHQRESEAGRENVFLCAALNDAPWQNQTNGYVGILAVRNFDHAEVPINNVCWLSETKRATTSAWHEFEIRVDEKTIACAFAGIGLPSIKRQGLDALLLDRLAMRLTRQNLPPGVELPEALLNANVGADKLSLREAVGIYVYKGSVQVRDLHVVPE